MPTVTFISKDVARSRYPTRKVHIIVVYDPVTQPPRGTSFFSALFAGVGACRSFHVENEVNTPHRAETVSNIQAIRSKNSSRGWRSKRS